MGKTVFKKYKLEEEHYQGITILQEHWAKKISSSSATNKEVKTAKQVLDFLDIIKKGQFYDDSHKELLNHIREKYYEDKKIDPSF